ncbi:MAG TPA: gluconokinase [Verrucomicrobiae bacterium]
MKTASFRRPLVLIFMGVAGSGKTTVAALFAKKTGATFYEGDEFHPPANIAKMRNGIPLTDGDREQWLQTLRKIVTRALAANESAVLTCSALKAKYRKRLQGGDSRVRFVHLTGPRTVLEERLKSRCGHFMPPGLLDSQLAALETPSDALTFSCEMPPEEIVAALVQTLGIRRPEHTSS